MLPKKAVIGPRFRPCGCVTQGETRAELEANLREAVAGWLEAGESGVDPTHEILELTV